MLARQEEVQQRVQTSLGLPTWEDVVKAAGPCHSPNRYVRKQHKGIGFMVAVPRQDCLQASLPTIADDPTGECQAIEDAAQSVRQAAFASYSEIEAIVQHAAGPGIPGHPGIGSLPRIYQDYRLDLLFRHDCLLSILGERDSARYNGLRLTVEHCGPWWAFANAAVLCDRPRVVHRDSEARIHNEDGPAVIFGNGVELFAWHGSWVPEEVIRCPGSVTRPMIKAQNDPKVQAALIQIYGAERYERERRPAPPRKPRNPLLISLPEPLDDKIGRASCRERL